MGILDSLIGGGLDYLSARETDKANQSANRANIEQAEKTRNLIKAGTTDPFQSTKFFDDGGFTTKLAPEREGTLQNAFATEGVEGQTNLINALARKEAFRDFESPVKSFDESLDISQRNNLLRQGEFEKGRGDIIESLIRTQGGTGSSNFQPAAIDAVGRYTDRLQLDDVDTAINRYLNTLGQVNTLATAGQVGPKIPGFAGESSQNALVASLANTRPATVNPSYSGALPFAAGSAVLGDIQQQERNDQAQKNFQEALRHLGSK